MPCGWLEITAGNADPRSDGRTCERADRADRQRHYASSMLRAEYGFEVLHEEEGTGLSPYGTEDPVLYRVIARVPVTS
jgi:hypothetical protein